MGHILLRNCLLKHVTEVKTEGTEIRERRKQLLDDLMETRRHCKLKQEAQDRTIWITHFGRGYGQDILRFSNFFC
jgi:hypothetical protein